MSERDDKSTAIGESEDTRKASQAGTDQTRESEQAAIIVEVDDDATVLDPSRLPRQNKGDDTLMTEDDVTQFSPPTSHAAYNAKPSKFSVAEGLLDQDNKILKSRFVLEKILGSGGMGTVYKAKDLRKVEARDRNPYVAVKVLNDDFSDHPDAFISLQREAAKSHALSHPNIVTIFDFDKDGDTPFMTMELMEGQELGDLLKVNDGGLDAELSWKIITGMCAALTRAHEARLIHSDFKPGNVFITSDGSAKVFDFGIARAVSARPLSAEAEDPNPDDGDRTVFDPGSLGALTPAYASLEMLQGEEPSAGDDLYALAIVIYQLFVGKHPFDRKPADQAFAEGKKAKPIKAMSRRQWNVLEKALSFRRKDRPVSVAEFYQQFTFKPRWGLRIASGLGVLIVAASVVYSQFGGKQIDRSKIEAEIEAEIGGQARVDAQIALLDNSLKDVVFSDLWEQTIAQNLTNIEAVVDTNDTRIISARDTVLAIYRQQINTALASGQLESVASLLLRAAPYLDIGENFEGERAGLNAAIAAREQNLKQAADDAQRLREQKLQAQRVKQQALAKQQALQQQQAQTAALQLRRTQLNQDVKPLFSLLKCNGAFRIRRFSGYLKQFKTKAGDLFPEYVDDLAKGVAGCISKVATVNADESTKIRTAAMTLFDGHPAIASITAVSADACNVKLAGQGSKRRGSCRDELTSGGYGPRLVVVPATQAIKAFAISRTEVPVAAINQFCLQHPACNPLPIANIKLPAQQVSIATAQAFIQWLSLQSGKTYRLPNEAEWLHAGTANGADLDPNRNCSLNVRGIKKGDVLLSVGTGQSNSWGLLNHVGNVQEWVTITNNGLKAVGGSRLHPIAGCTLATQTPHSGEADNITGFRVLRELN